MWGMLHEEELHYLINLKYSIPGLYVAFPLENL
jgi:hypothetical protein